MTGEIWHGVQPPPAEPAQPLRKRTRSLLDPSPSRWDREVMIDGADSWTHFNRDDLRGQMRSLRVLEQLLKRAAAEDLPALNWTVTAYAVSGEASLVDSRTPSQRRDVFLAWATALGFTDWREGLVGPGQVEIRGYTKVPAPGAPHLEVGIGLAAIWWDRDGDEAELGAMNREIAKQSFPLAQAEPEATT